MHSDRASREPAEPGDADAIDVAEYDTALADALLEGDPDDELAILARVTDSSRLPDEARVVSRFGDIVTLRIRRADAVALVRNDAVLGLELSRDIGPADADDPDDVADEVDAGARASPYERRPPGLVATGEGCVVAVLDWGCDFAHPALRRQDGTTRLLALWDQRGPARGDGNRWGYGMVLRADAINRALEAPDPYAALDYHPGDADAYSATANDWTGSHGTHVIDIAAGNGNGGGMPGVAPEADLVFVHLAHTTPAVGSGNLGDSVTLLEALDFAFEAAGDRPCVVNMSVGAHGGPHDGTTLVEQGIDRSLWLGTGRAVVNSAGNYFGQRAHAEGRLRPGEQVELPFVVPEADPTDSELETWYAASDRFTATVSGPDGEALATVRSGDGARLRAGGQEVARLHHVRHSGNGDHRIDLFLHPHAPGGTWTLTLEAIQADDGRYHAWIERERGLRPRFLVSHTSQTSTTGTLCNGRLSIAVGAFDPHRESRPLGRFSSAGPTRDGRLKPEIAAPGVRIRAGRSAAPGQGPGARYTTKSGTSMAAPHVAGAVALLFEVAGEPLEITDTRALLLASTDRSPLAAAAVGTTDVHRLGSGYLDLLAVEQVGLHWAAGEPGPHAHITTEAEADMAQDKSGGCCDESMEAQTPMDVNGDTGVTAPVTTEADLAPPAGAETAEELRDSLLGMAESALRTVAGPLMALDEEVTPGDVLVRMMPDGREHVGSVISQPAEREELVARGVPIEAGRSGLYVEVLEIPASGGSPRIIGRRLTDRWRRLPAGQRLVRADSETIPGTVLHRCRPGEGPPAALPDPDGRGLRPLVYRGSAPRRSRNPTVGYAQQLLNRFLADSAAGQGACIDTSPTTQAYTDRLRAELRTHGQDPLVVDCRFGPNTERATRMFQACRGLVRDGKIGPITWSHLEAYASAPSGTLNPPDTSTCGVPSLPIERTLEALDAELFAIAETPGRVAVRPRLSLFQNHSRTTDRNHFHCQASRMARQLAAYANPRADACTPRRIGPTQYDTGADIVAAVSAASACLGQRVNAVHIFGHSGSYGVFGTTGGAHGLYLDTDAASRATGARSIADVPAAALAEDAVVVLHGCNQAAGTDNFARALYRHLRATLRNPRVFAHHNSGCAGRDNSWREYSDRHPDGRNRGSIAPHYAGGGCCTPPARRTGTEAGVLDVAETDSESTVHECRPGEGPPAAVSDPEGKGPHPLVYRGVSPLRSRNPTVGHAQTLLNAFLDSTRSAGFVTCEDQAPGTLTFMALLRSQLQRAGQDPLRVDCRFGPSTEIATKIFQACHRLDRDGKIGPQTWTRLVAFGPALPSTPPSVSPSAPPSVVPPPQAAPPSPPSPPLGGPTFRPCCMLSSGSLKDAGSIGGHSDFGGIIYTGKAGFVDIGHVRDVVDLTAFAYQQIHAASGAAGTRVTTTEGHATLTASVPASEWLEAARSIAFDDALGHEIASYHSDLPGHHNSSFSPEDLCSNFLGTVVAARALAAGGTFAMEAERALQALLVSLDAQSLSETRAAFTLIDGRWVVRGLLGVADPRYLRRRNFSRTPFKAGHTSDAPTPALVTAPFGLTGVPYDYQHTRGRSFGRADFGAEISAIRTDARARYGPDFDKP